MTVNKKTVLSLAVVAVALLASSRASSSYDYSFKPKTLPLPEPDYSTPKPEKIKVAVFDAIKNASKKYKVPLKISLGVAKIESNFNPKAVSPKNASGLFQLMPKTALGLGVDNVFDPEQNANGGNRFLASLYRKYGNWPDALAAYNWGPGNMDSDKPIPNSVNDYVNKVLEASESYG